MKKSTHDLHLILKAGYQSVPCKSQERRMKIYQSEKRLRGSLQCELQDKKTALQLAFYRHTLASEESHDT